MTKANDLRNQRNGNIDMLRILATFFIVISHFVPKYLWNGNEELCGVMFQNLASMKLNDQIMMLYNTLGHIGNNLFVVCSAWFLLDSSHCKPKRLLSLEFDLVVLGGAWILITLLFGLPLSKSYVLRNLFPTFHYTYWFFSCYLLLYLLHPAYNWVLDKLNKKQLLTVDLILLLMYSVFQFVQPNAFYFTPLSGFTTIYFCTAYNKRFLSRFSQNRKANGIIMVCCAAALVLLNFINNFVGVHIPSYQWEMARWNNYINLFVIILGIGTFNFFSTLPKINSSALVSRLSSLSLIIYVLTESLFMQYYFKPWLYDWIYGRFDYSYIWLYVLIASAVAYIISAVCGTVYQILSAPIKEKFLNWILKYGTRLHNTITGWLLRLE